MDTALDSSPTEENPLRYLFGSPYRVKILQELDVQPSDPHELKERLQIPRSSLHRVVAELESKGWVQKTGSTVELESTGRYILDLYARIEEDIEIITVATRLSPWIRLDVEKLPTLKDGEVTTKGESPDPSSVFFEWIEENAPFEGYLPRTPPLFDKFVSLAPEDQFGDSVLYLRESEGKESTIEEVVNEFGGDIVFLDCEPRFGIFYSPPEVLIAGVDEVGDLRNTIITDNECAREFASEQFLRFEHLSSDTRSVEAIER